MNRLEDPRIEHSRRRVLRASLDELAEAGYGGFTIESVAARSGVAKSTIYRYWRDKLTLIADAFETFHQQQAPDIATGSPRERLERILQHVSDMVAKSIFSACMPALIDGAERDPRLRRFHHRFQREARKPLTAVIAEGVAAGDFPAHLNSEIAASALLGLLFYRRLMTSEPFRPERVTELLQAILGPKLTLSNPSHLRRRKKGNLQKAAGGKSVADRFAAKSHRAVPQS